MDSYDAPIEQRRLRRQVSKNPPSDMITAELRAN
jgi:hypothetical protein